MKQAFLVNGEMLFATKKGLIQYIKEHHDFKTFFEFHKTIKNKNFMDFNNESNSERKKELLIYKLYFYD